jgi:hypothetical protein
MEKWQELWIQICNMAFYGTNIAETLGWDEEPYDENDDLIKFEHVYNVYSKMNWDVFVVPELKQLKVPKKLFLFLGVRAFFSHSFPNCEFIFWEDTHA